MNKVAFVSEIKNNGFNFILTIVKDVFNVQDCQADFKAEVFDFMRVKIREDVFGLVVKTFYRLKDFILFVCVAGNTPVDFLNPMVTLFLLLFIHLY